MNKLCEALGLNADIYRDDTAALFLLAATRINRLSGMKAKCIEIAYNFMWPIDSPMWGTEAERTAEAIAKAIEESA